jgi:uncharacterized membrane protein YjjP (DUF1212 family)
VGGGSFAQLSDEDLVDNLAGLAQCLILLRSYLGYYGMPEKGGVKDQEMVLRECCKDLYAGATPLWALEYVMQRAAEGITGNRGVTWLLLPRKAIVFIPGTLTTTMFNMTRGFSICKMEAMEPVAVRLASFASNSSGTSNIPSRFPGPEEFKQAHLTSGTSLHSLSQTEAPGTPEELSEKILTLASQNSGLFFFVNSHEYEGTIRNDAIDNFWVVTDEEQELFTRLACIEAVKAIDAIDANESRLYKPWLVVVFRVVASAGACGFWFGGGWIDMIVAGFLAVVIAMIGESQALSKQERIVFEVVASFGAGLLSGVVALSWPNDTCFGAMALAGVLDILQGFRVVYAVIQVMSKFSVAGTADLVEGILFTGLIAYFLRFGQYSAAAILRKEWDSDAISCTNGISELWYILLVPLAALSWSGLFSPSYSSLWLMCFHGCFAYAVNYALGKSGASAQLNNFVSAAAVSISSGIISRFTGRQSVANTIAGLYVLLPGAYLVTSLYASEVTGDFFVGIVERAVGIGIGAWTGSVLCSPTLLGTTRGLAAQQRGSSGESMRRNSGTLNSTMLIF